jgi:hypothetical protein
MAAGEQATETEVIVLGTVTVTAAEPDFVLSCVEVAVIFAVPAAAGVNAPEDVMAPSVAAQVTVGLYAPVP